MSQWALELYKGTAVIGGVVAPVAGGAGVFAAVASADNAYFPHIARIDADGAVVWKRAVTPPVGSAAASQVAIASGAGFVAFAATNVISSVNMTHIALLNAADGALVWQTSIPGLRADTATGSLIVPNALLVDASGNVFVTGRPSNNSAQYLVKLAAADGTIAWQQNLLEFGLATQDYPAQLALMPLSGDVAVALLTSGLTPIVHRISAATGAKLWSASVVWTKTGSLGQTLLLAADPADNLYAVGASANTGQVSLVKFDADGAPLWLADVLQTTPTITFASGGAGATAEGVYFGLYAGFSSPRAGVCFVSAAGNTATAAYFVNVSPLTFTTGAEALAVGADAVFLTVLDQPGGVLRTVLVSQSLTQFGASTNLPAGYARVPYGMNVVAGTAIVDTPELTYPAVPALTRQANDLTLGASTLSTALYVQNVIPNQSGVASAIAPTSRFGSARRSTSWPASAIAPSGQFGLPALDFNLETYATSLAPGGKFGVAIAMQYLYAEKVHYVTGIGGGAELPAPAVLATFSGTATGIADTQFGVPELVKSQRAESIAPAAAFGMPRLLQAASASGIQSTRLGTPALTTIHQGKGFASGTRFGLPGTKASGGHAASGFCTTQLGVPMTHQQHLAKFTLSRARFGLALVKRPC